MFFCCFGGGAGLHDTLHIEASQGLQEIPLKWPCLHSNSISGVKCKSNHINHSCFSRSKCSMYLMSLRNGKWPAACSMECKLCLSCRKKGRNCGESTADSESPTQPTWIIISAAIMCHGQLGFRFFKVNGTQSGMTEKSWGSSAHAYVLPGTSGQQEIWPTIC